MTSAARQLAANINFGAFAKAAELKRAHPRGSTDGPARHPMFKRWDDRFLAVGSGNEDQLFAEALSRTAKRFSANIVEKRIFDAEPRAVE